MRLARRASLLRCNPAIEYVLPSAAQLRLTVIARGWIFKRFSAALRCSDTAPT